MSIESWRTVQIKRRSFTSVGMTGCLFALLVVGLLALNVILWWQPLPVAQAEQDTPAATLTSSASPTASALPSATPSFTPSPTASPTPTRRPTSTPTASSTPPPVPTRYVSPTPPPSVLLGDFIGHPQTYSLSCEARAAADWATYLGVPVDELAFQSHLPLSDNPHKGFVGNVQGGWGQVPPHDYGVYAEPVASLLRSYGLPARAVRNFSWEGIQGQLGVGRPVIVWVVGRVGLGTPIAYTASDGMQTVVARFEHVVVVIGYEGNDVIIQDGAQRYRRALQDFLKSWEVLGRMAVIYQP